MNLCKEFSKKHPALLAALSFFFMWGLLKLNNFVPEGPLNFGICECILAVVVFAVTFLFMGKEKVSFSSKGFGYGFGLLRGYFTFMICLTAFGILSNILGSVVLHKEFPYQLLPFANILIAGLFVGVAEEFLFRGIMFGGLVQKLGNTKKAIVISALISGFSFGLLHVIGAVLGGAVTDFGSGATAVLKIVQCAIFGVILCFVYYKTRNIYVIAVLHSLDDFMMFVTVGANSTGASDYVITDSKTALLAIGAYALFTIILVPSLIRSIKDITPGEAIPFDNDFMPRAVEFVRKSKKQKAAK